jgi:hypothetical protein
MRRLGLLYFACRNPPLCNGAGYFDPLLNDICEVLDFGAVVLFSPDFIGSLQSLSGSTESGSGITRNQRIAKRFLIGFAGTLQSRVLNRRTTDDKRCEEEN